MHTSRSPIAPTRLLPLAILTACFLLPLTACGSSSGGSGPTEDIDLPVPDANVSPDAPPDVVPDGVPDVVPDGIPDGISDGVPDGVSDGVPDGVPDVGLDADVDADPLGPCTPGVIAACLDDDLCNGAETCDPETGECVAGEYVVCTDGDDCNGVETCVLDTGKCQLGDAPICDDGDPCTQDGCNPAFGCTIEPMCDDGDPCTVDICDPENFFCDVEPKDCDDGLLCTVDTCDSETGDCSHAFQWADNPACDDDNGCTIDVCAETCDEDDGECIHSCEHDTIVCNDANACTLGACDPGSGDCVWTDVSCNDGNACTEDWCAPNGGCFWTSLDCDDSDICTVDTCDLIVGCEHDDTPFGVPACNDGDPCTIDTCALGVGCQHTAKDCDDKVSCTVDSCDQATGACEHDASAAGCEDGDPCTVDTCDAEGGCGSVAKDCDDLDACTTDSCSPATGACLHAAVACSDGDPCNGAETCHPIDGTCLDGEPVTCQDTNLCDGIAYCDEDSGTCVEDEPVDCYETTPDWDGCDGTKQCNAAWGGCETKALTSLFCPFAPEQCDQNGGTGAWDDDAFKELPGGSFVLRDQETWAKNEALADQIAEHWSVNYVSMEAILFNKLNRTATPINPGPDCGAGGFIWNDSDAGVPYWYPQGVTTSAAGWGDTSQGQNGTVGGTKTMLVSWYHKPEEDSGSNFAKGVRIAIVDISFSGIYKYRLAMLAEPKCYGTFVDGKCDSFLTYQPLTTPGGSLHAGGIVWYQNYLYVADTSNGFRVFDLSRIQEVQTGLKSKLGYTAIQDEWHAYNYRYVIPQVGTYKLCGKTCCGRFSFASLDRTTDPPTILAGEYALSQSKLTGSTVSNHGRLHRWPLNPDTGRLAIEHKVLGNTAAYFPSASHMQGALSIDGHYYISSSYQFASLPNSGSTLYDVAPGGSLDAHDWPRGPEDLTYDSFTGRIWMCTEYEDGYYLFLNDTRFCLYVYADDVKNNSCD